MSEQIDYKEAWKNLLFDFSRMVVDDFDRYEKENNMNIYEMLDYSHPNRFFRYKHRKLIMKIVKKNADYILRKIEIRDIKQLVKINKLKANCAEYNFYSEILAHQIRENFYKIYSMDMYKLNLSIIDKANERGWNCCGKRRSINYYYRHLKSKTHSCETI